jgi:predicted GTPase
LKSLGEATLNPNINPHEVDVQATQILQGLQQLERLLEEPETEEALDLAKNARTTEQYNILRKLRKSLTQYLGREGDLFYVGLVGHFSSGKSSTINSVLGIWDTDHQRKTDLNPTDTTITLITSDANAKSLLGVIKEGHVTIRHESVNNPILNKVVIADTPGSGDTQFVEEVARDFLPICDVILFFFSATSPLDKTDLPLLTEIHKKLQFIPIRFVITRADEFRTDFSCPVSDSNIDALRRDRFVGEFLTRLNKLLQPTIYTEEHFMLIDNKSPQYNIEKLVELIQTKCDPHNPNARIVMHGHKLRYFQSASRELKSFFGNFLDEKLKELTKIVDTAHQNIQSYNENVIISNSNLTKNWLDQLTSIRSTRERMQKTIGVTTPLPGTVDSFTQISARHSAISKSLLEESLFTARQIDLKAKLEILQNLRSRIEHTNLWELVTTADGRLTTSNLIDIKPDTLLPVTPAGLASDWTSLREARVQALRDAAADLRKQCSDLAALIDKQNPIRECETEVTNAQKSLTLDLNQFFKIAELYRDGVFSHTTKESISALGIGAQLDALEAEFTKNDTMAFTSETMQLLFPDFSEGIAKGLTKFAALQEQTAPLITELGELKVPSPLSGSREVHPSIEVERAELLSFITTKLRDDTQNLIGRLEIRLSGATAEARRQYESDILAARRRRLRLYGTMTAGAMILAFLGYALYALMNRDVPQDIFNAIIWNVVASVISGAIGAALAKWRDDFPRTTKRIRDDSEAILREKILKIVEEEFRTHEFSALDESYLSRKLVESYTRIVNLDPDGWNQLASERLDVLRKYDNEFRRLRGEYERSAEEILAQTSLYFSDASKNLERLNEVAARVKARAIEPSFKLLATTRDSLNDVKEQIHAVEFSH